MNNYGTHYPILAELLDKFNLEHVLEFGTGFFSTGIFVEKAKKVVSIEMQYVDWYDKVKEKYSKYVDSGVLSIECIIEDSGLQSIQHISSNYDKPFDMVFVDGAGGSRFNCANYAKSMTDLIICHDTEYHGYHWDRIVVDGDWVWIDVKIYGTWTSVMTTRKDIIDFVSSFDSESIIRKYDGVF